MDTNQAMGEFAKELRRHGFSAKDKGEGYFGDRWGETVAASGFGYRVLKYGGTEPKAMASWLERLDDYRSESTVRLLRADLPPRARGAVEAKVMTFSHFERVGLFKDANGWKPAKEPSAVLHVHHRLQCDPFFDLFENGRRRAMMYEMELLAAWHRTDHVNESLIEALGKTFAERVEAHLSEVCVALVSMREDYETNEERVDLQCILRLPEDAGTVVAAAAGACAALLARKDDDYMGGFGEDPASTFSLYGGGPAIATMDAVRTDLLIKVAEAGRASTQPAPKEKSAIGAVQIVAVAIDSHYAVRNGCIVPRPNDGEDDDGDDGFDDDGDDSIDHAADDADDEGTTPLAWWFVIDDGSGAYFAEPHAGDRLPEEIRPFLERAWQRKSEVLFEGRPQTLVLPKNAMGKKERAALEAWLRDKDITLASPSSGFAAGISTARQWIDDARSNLYHKARTGLTLDELNAWCAKQQVFSFAKSLAETGSKPYRTVLFYGEDHYSGFGSIRTEAFCAHVKRRDAVAVIERVTMVKVPEGPLSSHEQG